MSSGEWAFVIAIASLLLSGVALAQSIRSARASERSATAAEESKDIAADALDFQRQRAVSETAAAVDAQRANVIPLYWQRRPGELRGLVLENIGGGPAIEIRTVSNAGSQRFVAREWPGLNVGQKVGLMQTVATMDGEDVGAPDTTENRYAVKIWWTNIDGSRASGNWTIIPAR